MNSVILGENEKLDRDACVRKCLQKCVPLLLQHGVSLLQDGAACHRSAIEYLRRKEVDLVEPYPPRSPDLNLIETAWAKLQRDTWRLRPSTREELVSAIKVAWEGIDDKYLENLFGTWKKRLQNVISLKGGM